MALEVKANIDDLAFVFCAALRYGLGRQTYATTLIPRVIMANFALLDERWTIVLLRDLIEYERNRMTWLSKDGACDYESWMDLKQRLMNLYTERGYTRRIE